MGHLLAVLEMEAGMLGRILDCPRVGLALLLGALAAPFALPLASGVLPPAAAQREPPPSRAAMQYSFAPIVKRAVPAVVNVYVRSRVQTMQSPFANDPVFGRMFGEMFGMPQERIQSSLGSGVIVSADGTIVTNAHVVKGSGATEVRIVLADRREFDARVILQDEKSDIAVLRIAGDGGRFPFLEFEDSDRVEVGDMVLAIGNPFGVGQTVTSGIISALARTEVAASDAQVFLQTDAAINPGNSGGALVDMAGKLVGINTAIFSKSGGSVGIGFAIPSNLVKVYVDSAISGRKVERPWLGARLEPVTREIADQFKLPRVTGAFVARVYSDGPAAQAGLRAGDVIVGVDGFEVADPRAALYRLTTRGIGNRAELAVLRGGRQMSLKVGIAAPPAPGRDDVRNLSGRHPLDGARVSNLLPSVADQLGIDAEKGVVVLSVRNGSTAARLGFRQGDIVQQVGRVAIDTVAQLERALTEPQRVWLMAIRRGDQTLQLQVGG
jgi:Do/DeqQ family serine protease